jgi:hypothetical protein
VTGAFERFRLAVPEQQVARMLLGQATFSRQGPLSPWVVTWLMIFQRLDPKGTLSAAVRHLLTGPVRGLIRWPEGARTLPLSANTSAYSQARCKLPLEVAEQVSELLFESLQEQSRILPGLEQPVFLLDGSTILLAHSPALAKAYPPPRNQHGASHWPVIRVLVAHDVVSGLAAPPCWGPMDGPQAVSEQGLAKEIMGRLPAGCGVLGDRNFGVFSMAYHATHQKHPCLFRLTEVRARKLNGGVIAPPAKTDKAILWSPSREDLRSNPEIPASASVAGRLLACKVRDAHGKWQKLYFFTTFTLPPEQILGVYGYRWNIGVSSQGHIVQSVKDRPRSKDSDLVAGEASWRESKTAEPSDNMLGKECAQRTRLQRTVNADVASLHESPVAETVDNARKQQELAETSPMRQFSPAGYQRRHGVKDDVETGEALGARRRKLVEEMPAITASGKCGHRRQGDGSGRSTGDGRAAKRARREGPGPVSTPLTKVRQG